MGWQCIHPCMVHRTVLPSFAFHHSQRMHLFKHRPFIVELFSYLANCTPAVCMHEQSYQNIEIILFSYLANCTPAVCMHEQSYQNIEILPYYSHITCWTPNFELQTVVMQIIEHCIAQLFAARYKGRVASLY